VGLPKVLRHLKRAAKLDPYFGGAAALRVHATILKVVPRMFGGGKKKAEVLIEEAIKIAPSEPLNYEILADILIEKYKDPDSAVEAAQRGLAVPTPGPEFVESRDSIDYLKRVVKRYGPSTPQGS
ncbi:MAG: TRAP transporter TatT component family protein, partial [Myxococcota bacterium]